MTETIEKEKIKKEKPSFLEMLAEDDSPDIGIATKEPLADYAKGVKSEFKKIEWPTREQVTQEFIAVIVIVTIIAILIFGIDKGLDKLIEVLPGAKI